MPEAKFQEGQRVRVVDPNTTMFDWGENDEQYQDPNQFVDTEAVITYVGWTPGHKVERDYFYQVKLDAVPYEQFWYQEHQLELVQ